MTDTSELLETDSTQIGEGEVDVGGHQETESPSTDPISAAIEKAHAKLEERDSVSDKSEASPLSDAARTLASAKKAKATSEKAPTNLDQSAKVEQPRADKAQVESTQAPHFWSSERKALFSKAEPQLQKAIVEEVQKTEQWARGIAQEAKEAVQVRDELDKIFGPYDTKFRQIGATRLQVADRLMAWQDQLDENPVQAINKLLRSYNLSPEHLLHDGYEEPYRDPAVDEQARRIQELETQIQAITESAQGQRYQGVQSQIEKFINETDEAGNLLHPHVQRLEPQIAHQVKSLRASNPNASEYQLLKAAYDQVISEIESNFVQPKLSVVQNQNQKAETDQRRAEQAKKAANATLRGIPAPGAVSNRPKAKNVDEAMERAWSRMTGS